MNHGCLLPVQQHSCGQSTPNSSVQVPALFNTSDIIFYFTSFMFYNTHKLRVKDLTVKHKIIKLLEDNKREDLDDPEHGNRLFGITTKAKSMIHERNN